MPNRIEDTIQLKDGRALGYAEYGDPGGRPLFFFHGFPNSRLGPEVTADQSARQGIRVIALERPGFGLSDFKPDRTIADWPDDVVEAADALGIERFAVLGASGGGPYAAACAAKIPERLTSAAIVSGWGPVDAPNAMSGLTRAGRFLLSLGRRIPLLVSLSMWYLALLVRFFPDLLIALSSRSMPDADREIMRRPELKAAIKADLREAFRQGIRGAVHEAKLYLRPWKFRLADISMEVHLWHGEDDATVPVSMGRHVAATIPNCRATFYPGEGHLMAVDRMTEIQSAIFPGLRVSA